MPESKQPHRRRRLQGLSEPQGEEDVLGTQPHRIVVSEGDEPEWMVSATRISGAAERRAQAAPAARAPRQEAENAPVRMRSQDKRTQESMAILSLKKQGKESETKEAPANAAEASERRERPAPAKEMHTERTARPEERKPAAPRKKAASAGSAAMRVTCTSSNHALPTLSEP